VRVEKVIHHSTGVTQEGSTGYNRQAATYTNPWIGGTGRTDVTGPRSAQPDPEQRIDGRICLAHERKVAFLIVKYTVVRIHIHKYAPSAE